MHIFPSKGLSAPKIPTASACNRSEQLSRHRTSVVVHSPSYPRPYPNAINCIVDLTVPPGWTVVVNFDQFDLEDEEE